MDDMEDLEEYDVDIAPQLDEVACPNPDCPLYGDRLQGSVGDPCEVCGTPMRDGSFDWGG